MRDGRHDYIEIPTVSDIACQQVITMGGDSLLLEHRGGDGVHSAKVFPSGKAWERYEWEAGWEFGGTFSLGEGGGWAVGYDCLPATALLYDGGVSYCKERWGLMAAGCVDQDWSVKTLRLEPGQWTWYRSISGKVALVPRSISPESRRRADGLVEEYRAAVCGGGMSDEEERILKAQVLSRARDRDCWEAVHAGLEAIDKENLEGRI